MQFKNKIQTLDQNNRLNTEQRSKGILERVEYESEIFYLRYCLNYNIQRACFCINITI